MRSFTKPVCWALVAAVVVPLVMSSCATEKEKHEKAMRKQVGTTEWYAERERKRKTSIKDKKELKDIGYTRDQDPMMNPGTGLSIPKPEKKKKHWWSRSTED